MTFLQQSGWEPSFKNEAENLAKKSHDSTSWSFKEKNVLLQEQMSQSHEEPQGTSSPLPLSISKYPTIGFKSHEEPQSNPHGTSAVLLCPASASWSQLPSGPGDLSFSPKEPSDKAPSPAKLPVTPLVQDEALNHHQANKRSSCFPCPLAQVKPSC